MGSHPNIRHDKFPKQGGHRNQPCRVCFHYDTTNVFTGKIIRDDAEEPYETIILLDNGQAIRGVECQYRLGK